MEIDWNSAKFEWDPKKSKEIKRKRGYSFEELVEFIKNGKVLEFIRHHNTAEYPNQWFIIVDVNGYPWAIASEFRGNKLRLVTAFPARKYKRLLGDK